MTVSHLCKVGQDKPDPRLGLILSQGKGRKGLLRWVVVPAIVGHLGWRDSLLSEGRSWGTHQLGRVLPRAGAGAEFRRAYGRQAELGLVSVTTLSLSPQEVRLLF